VSELLLDVTRLVGRRLKQRLPTGIDRVCLAYVEKYRSSARAVIQTGSFGTILSRSASESLFSLLLAPTAPFLREAAVSVGRSLLTAGAEASVAGSFVLNLGHSGLERRPYAAWLKRKGLRPVFMVHDLIPLTHPEYCRPLEKARHGLRMRTVLKSATGILTNSSGTLAALSNFAVQENLTLPRAVVAPLAGARLPAPSAERPVREPYFVMLSTIEPRKNHWTILHVWRRLVEQLGDRAPRLVVIGQRGWECENVVDLLERSESLRGVVLERPRCSDQELATYLHHAQALLFPSLAEGYGMPLVEALAAKVPVIASDLAVFREIAADAPDYLDPLNGASWADRIEAFSGALSPARAAALTRLERFTAPSWATHFNRFEALLGQL
jgi:glycosyltransferase involved in cell wall biosynthesis